MTPERWPPGTTPLIFAVIGRYWFEDPPMNPLEFTKRFIFVFWMLGRPAE